MWRLTLSILFMRFIVVISRLPHQLLSLPFNSLYEIRHNAECCFNSTINLSLSILFMRFIRAWLGRLLETERFQFSLWDSDDEGFNRPLRFRAFNSLYEIQVATSTSQSGSQGLSFNSLYEIRRQRWRTAHREFCFQFSLWDSWALTSWLCKSNIYLSILFMRFSWAVFLSVVPDHFQFSLWDSIVTTGAFDKLRLYLSILFMRFYIFP